MAGVDLPPGFILDQPNTSKAGGADLPDGFVLDAPAAAPIPHSFQAQATDDIANAAIAGAKRGWGSGAPNPETVAANARANRDHPTLAPLIHGANWLADNTGRALGAGMGAAQGAVAGMGAELGMPGLGRDVAAIPESLAGMPGLLHTPGDVPPDSGLRMGMAPPEPPGAGLGAPRPGGPRVGPTTGAAAEADQMWEQFRQQHGYDPRTESAPAAQPGPAPSSPQEPTPAAPTQAAPTPAAPPPEPAPEAPPAEEKPGASVAKADVKPGHEVTWFDFKDPLGPKTTGKVASINKDGKLVVDLADGTRQTVRPDSVLAARVPVEPIEPVEPVPNNDKSAHLDTGAEKPEKAPEKAAEPETQTATAEKPKVGAETPTAEQPVAKVEPKPEPTGNADSKPESQAESQPQSSEAPAPGKAKSTNLNPRGIFVPPPPGHDEKQEFTYTSKKGRVLTGTLRTGLDVESARKLDPTAFPLGDGKYWFVKSPKKAEAAPDPTAGWSEGPWTEAGKNEDGQPVYRNPQGRHAVNEDGAPWMETPDTEDDARAPRFTVVEPEKPAAKPTAKPAAEKPDEVTSVKSGIKAVQPVTMPEGDKYFPPVASGERLRSKSGREMAPVPNFTIHSNRAQNIGRAKLNDWLLSEARKEVAATGDTFTSDMLKGLDPKNFSQSDRDMATEVLFGGDRPKPEHRIAEAAPKSQAKAPEAAAPEPGLSEAQAKKAADIEGGRNAQATLRAHYEAADIQEERNFSFPEMSTQHGMAPGEWEAEQKYRMLGRGQADPDRAARFDAFSEIAGAHVGETERQVAAAYAKHGVTPNDINAIGNKLGKLNDDYGAVNAHLRAKYGPAEIEPNQSNNQLANQAPEAEEPPAEPEMFAPAPKRPVSADEHKHLEGTAKAANNMLQRGQRDPTTTPEKLTQLQQQADDANAALNDAEGPPPKPAAIPGGKLKPADLEAGWKADTLAHADRVAQRQHEEGGAATPDRDNASAGMSPPGVGNVHGFDSHVREWVGTGHAIVQIKADKAFPAMAKKAEQRKSVKLIRAPTEKLDTLTDRDDSTIPITWLRTVPYNSHDTSYVVGQTPAGTFIGLQKHNFDLLSRAAGPGGSLFTKEPDKATDKTSPEAVVARNAQGDIVGVGMPIRATNKEASIWAFGMPKTDEPAPTAKLEPVKVPAPPKATQAPPAPVDVWANLVGDIFKSEGAVKAGEMLTALADANQLALADLIVFRDKAHKAMKAAGWKGGPNEGPPGAVESTPAAPVSPEPEPPAAPEPPKYPDGRLIPQVGDKVFQEVAGFGGMPSMIYGEVFAAKASGDVRVRTTGSAALIGSAKVGKTYPLSPNWTVVGDPELARREEARAQAERDRDAAREAEARVEEILKEGWAKERGTLDPETVNVGDVIEGPDWSEANNWPIVKHLVGEKDHDSNTLYAAPLDQPGESFRSMGGDLRGWRKVDAPIPDGHRINDEDRLKDSNGFGAWKMRINSQWVPVDWDADANAYVTVPQIPAETGTPSWAPELKVDGKWSRNGLRFATQGEAEAAARDLFHRWPMAEDSRAAEADEPVTYRWDAEKGLVPADAPLTQSAEQTEPGLQPTPGAPTAPTQETPDGVQTTVRPGDAAAGPQDVQPTVPVGTVRSPSSGQKPRSPRDAEGNPGASPAGQIRQTDDAGGAGGGGAGVRGDAGLPAGTETTAGAPGTTGRPPRGRVAAPELKGQNFVIEPGDLAEERSRMEKARDNLAAIELVKQLQAEDRPATTAEQEVLVKYVGWGGIKNAFRDSDGRFGTGMETIGRRLEELLSEKEYKAAEESIQNAHYTAEHVVRAMWDAVEAMGFTGGDVFEPGMGIGHFLGLMPPDLAERSKYRGLERDSITADIAKALYPQSSVIKADYARRAMPEKAFDLAIGNPPFANVVISEDPKYAAHGFVLHDYFFAKTLDAVRPGGLLGFITSAGTMNKMDPKAQKYLAERAEFVGGIRLPSSAFQRNAMTGVTTDILFFKRRMEGQVPIADDGMPDWTGTVRRTLPNGEGVPIEGEVSRYFSDHPEMVLGIEGFNDKLWKDRYAVTQTPGTDLATDLRAAMDRLPRNVMEDEPAAGARTALDFDATEKKEGSYYVAEDGTLMQYSRGAGRPVAARGAGVEGGMTTADRDRVIKLIPVRDALRRVFAADLAHDDAAGKAARADLNKHYDNFVKWFGPINKAEISHKRPSIVQQETARAEAREEARFIGEYFNEGDFDPTSMIAAKKPWGEIATARQAARVAALESGAGFNEGEFTPNDMPDVVIDKRPNIRPFILDPESYRLRSIEKYDDETGKAEKKDIFHRSIVKEEVEPQINSAQDGVLWSMNKLGRLDIPAIAAKMGVPAEQIVTDLGDAVYRVPGTHDAYQTNDEYLSGDVVTKLENARAAAKTDPAMERNVKALEAAQPAPLPPGKIGMMLGMPWIPPKTLSDFVSEHLQLGQPRIAYEPAVGAWSVTPARNGAENVPGYHTWSTPQRSAFDLLEDALNRSEPKIYFPKARDEPAVIDKVATQAAADKIQKIKDAFFDPKSRLGWVMANPERAGDLADLYNKKMNRTVRRQHDGSYLTTPGVADTWTWRPHQTAVVSRIILEGTTYMAHAVGAGKTSAMIGAGMEMKRLGLVKKPMYVVPNHMLGQFTKEFYEQYPTARIAVADADGSFITHRRKQFMANVAQDDLDAVIITHSSFGKIPISQEFQDDLINEEIEILLAAIKKAGDRFTVGRLQNQIAKLKQKLSKQTGDKKDETLTFEEMGIDFLFVDEAHLFRKLSFASAQTSIKGIDPAGSAMSWDLYTKIRYLDGQKPGRAAVFASGTPVTNTMGELYSLSRYLQPRALKARGLEHFDAWSKTFGDLQTALEETPAGTYAPVTRFNRFMNLPELYQMVSGIMDIVTSNDLAKYVVRPKLKGGERKLHMAPRTEFLDGYQADLARRMEIIKARRGKPEKGDDIMLSVINDGRHAALDPRYNDDEQRQSDPRSKLNMMIDNVIKIYHETGDVQFHDPSTNYEKESFRGPATQMVFANMGVNARGPQAFSGYRWMKEAFRRAGIPKEQVAFIGDYQGTLARQKLFNDMNEGKVRILIGSVQKMGTGVNAQRRLIAVHNEDPLWFPADDEQRNGRILRQGNHNREIQIHDYTTFGTYDSSMWGMMAKKAGFIEQFFRGDPNLRDMEDLGEASMYAQAAAMSTTDPRMITLTELKQDLDRAQRRQSAHEQEQWSLRSRMKEAQQEAERLDRLAGHIRQDIAQRTDTKGKAFNMVVAGEPFTDRVEALAAVKKEIDERLPTLGEGAVSTIGKIGGFPLQISVWDVDKKTGERSYIVRLAMNGARVERLSKDDTVASAENTLRGLENDLDYAERKSAEQKRDAEGYKPHLGKEFEGGPEIERLAEAIRELEATLRAEAQAAEAAKAGNAPPEAGPAPGQTMDEHGLDPDGLTDDEQDDYNPPARSRFNRGRRRR